MAGLKIDWLAAANEPISDIVWPDWMQAKKQTALEALSKLPGPHRKLELWRYSDAARLQKSELASVVRVDREIPMTEGAVVINLTGNGIDFSQKLPSWVTIKPIQDLPENQWIELHVDSSLAKELVVQSLNQGLFTHGVMVNVSAAAPKGATLVLRYDVVESNHWTYLRNVISLDADAEVIIDEQFIRGRINVVNNYKVAENAHLTRHQHNVLESGQQHVSLQYFTLAEKSFVQSQSRHESGDLQHHIHWVDFTAENAIARSEDDVTARCDQLTTNAQVLCGNRGLLDLDLCSLSCHCIPAKIRAVLPGPKTHHRHQTGRDSGPAHHAHMCAPRMTRELLVGRPARHDGASRMRVLMRAANLRNQHFGRGLEFTQHLREPRFGCSQHGYLRRVMIRWTRHAFGNRHQRIRTQRCALQAQTQHAAVQRGNVCVIHQIHQILCHASAF